MIKFFRHIRHNLIKENRKTRSASPVGRYVFYAFGEIILVVIGILIALSINNWNENRKNRVREKMYLISLMKDMEDNKKEMLRVIGKTDSIVLANRTILSYSENLDEIPDPKIHDSILDYTFGYTIAMTNEGTINDITGSGDLSVIRNDSLRRMIASWEANFKMIREREILLKEAFKNHIDKLAPLANLYRVRRFREPFLTTEQLRMVLSQNSYKNNFMDCAFNAVVLNEYYLEMTERMETMMRLISNEMEDLK